MAVVPWLAFRICLPIQKRWGCWHEVCVLDGCIEVLRKDAHFLSLDHQQGLLTMKLIFSSNLQGILGSFLGCLFVVVSSSFCPAAFAGGEDELGLAMTMYSTQRAKNIGDLLTVVVDEEISSSTEEGFNTKKDASASAQAPVFGDPAGSDISDSLAKIDWPQYQISAGSEFGGTGSQTLQESMAARFTVRVVDTLDNGLLVIKGDRKLKLKTENITITLTGLVRPRDVSATNAILSSQISDARITYDRNGEVSRGSRPGFLWRIFQFINPW